MSAGLIIFYPNTKLIKELFLGNKIEKRQSEPTEEVHVLVLVVVVVKKNNKWFLR